MDRNPTRSAMAALLIVAATLSVSGSGSIGARGNLPPEMHYPYMGVLSDWRTITTPDPFIVGAMIDLPLSVVVDTVLALVDLLTVLRKEECGRRENVERFSVPMTDRPIIFEAPLAFAGAVDFEATSSRIYNRLPVDGQVSQERITGTVGRGRGRLRLKNSEEAIRVYPFDSSRPSTTEKDECQSHVFRMERLQSTGAL